LRLGSLNLLPPPRQVMVNHVVRHSHKLALTSGQLHTTPLSGKLHETVHVTNSEANLDLSADREHIALPQVVLGATLIDVALIGHPTLDALSASPPGGRPLASDTLDIGSGRSATLTGRDRELGIARLVHRAGQHRTNRPLIRHRIDEQWTTIAVQHPQS